MTRTIYFRGTRAECKAKLHQLLAEIPKANGEYAELVRGIKLRVGMEALACIQEDFAKKANGEVGADGTQWEPLKKETIAYSRNGGEPKQKPKAGQRGLLTDEENRRWRRYYFTRRLWFMTKFGMGEKEASAAASKVAWAKVKAEGAKTKLEHYGNRKVQIGRINDRLYDSLSPGGNPETQSILAEIPDAPRAEDRVLRDEPGSVVVGSNVDYAERFHGKRPLWPAGELPGPWKERIEESTATGIAEAVAVVMEGHG